MMGAPHHREATNALPALLLCLGTLPVRLAPGQCALGGSNAALLAAAVPPHGTLNGFCADPSKTLPDLHGCFIRCAGGRVAAGQQPYCDGVTLRPGSVRCVVRGWECLRSPACLRLDDRGCIDQYDDLLGPGFCAGLTAVRGLAMPWLDANTLVATTPALDAAVCTSSLCPGCLFSRSCDRTCSATTGTPFCDADDATVPVLGTRSFSLAHTAHRATTAADVSAAAPFMRMGPGVTGSVELVAARQYLTATVVVERAGWRGGAGRTRRENEAACVVAQGLAAVAGMFWVERPGMLPAYSGGALASHARPPPATSVDAAAAGRVTVDVSLALALQPPLPGQAAAAGGGGALGDRAVLGRLLATWRRLFDEQLGGGQDGAGAAGREPASVRITVGVRATPPPPHTHTLPPSCCVRAMVICLPDTWWRCG